MEEREGEGGVWPNLKYFPFSGACPKILLRPLRLRFYINFDTLASSLIPF